MPPRPTLSPAGGGATGPERWNAVAGIPRRACRAAALLATLAVTACTINPGRVPQIVHAPDARPIVVETGTGAVSGVRTAQAQAFLGIPFAAPPVGPLRFRPPAPALPWSGTRDATRSGPACPQPGPGHQSEDCLNLNIYAPPDAGPASGLPVMVWLHGGANILGANTQYDPSLLAAKQGVIVVSPNYRLAALGFLAHPALRGPGEGGLALLDQQAALRWVKSNIGRFGGDPGRVTLFGESAGAWSSCAQLASPGARGLFHRAILQSGSCVSSDSSLPMAEAERAGIATARALGCTVESEAEACLRDLPASRLGTARIPGDGTAFIRFWNPPHGGDVLPQAPRDAFAAGTHSVVPVILGTNREEGRLFASLLSPIGRLATRSGYERGVRQLVPGDTRDVLAEYEDVAGQSYFRAYSDVLTDRGFACPALELAQLLSRHGPVHAYEFDDPRAPFVLPRWPFTPPVGAYHAAEIAYVFQRPWALADPGRFDAAQLALSDRMQRHWAAFARTGSPEAAGVPAWPVHDGGEPIRLSPEPMPAARRFAEVHRCAFWARRDRRGPASPD